MENIGTYVIYVIMACAVVGAIAYVVNAESELGKEFIAGLNSIGPIFVPVAGIMASIPLLSELVSKLVGPLYASIGADPAIAATTLIAADMGGYQLAKALAQSPEGWIVATVAGFMSGATLIFSIPVGLAMLKVKDHKYMALGVMAGLLSIPAGVAITALLIHGFGVMVRPEVATTGAPSAALTLSLPGILVNILPLLIFCVVLAAGLRFAPKAMITGFLWFGRLMHAAIVLVLVASIVQYFTGFFSYVFGEWPFAPVIADAEDQFRALEIAGYIGIMLCGAFPMVYLINYFLSGPVGRVGSYLGLSPVGAAGLLAASANILAMFRLIGDMPPKDKVLVIAFAVCAAFTFGDHLAFSANFQPSIILPLMLGKLSGGAIGFGLAMWLSVPRVREISQGDDRVSSGRIAATA